MPGNEATIEYLEKQFETTGNGVQDNSGFQAVSTAGRTSLHTCTAMFAVYSVGKGLWSCPFNEFRIRNQARCMSLEARLTLGGRERGRKIRQERLSVVPPPAKDSEHTTAEGARHVHPWVLIALLAGLLLGVACSQFISYVLHSTALAHFSDGSVYARGPAANDNRNAFAPPNSTRQD